MSIQISVEKLRTIDKIIEHRLGIPGTDFLDGLTSDQLEEFDVLDLEPRRSRLWDELKGKPLRTLRKLLKGEVAILNADAVKILRPLDKMEAQRWVDHDVWTVPEAVALSFGVAPQIADFHDELHAWAGKNYRLHPRAKEVIGRYQVIGVAIQAGTLIEPIKPHAFLGWLATKTFAPPDVLKLFQIHHGFTFAELSSLYDKEKLRTAELEKQVETMKVQLHARLMKASPTLDEIFATMIDLHFKSDAIKGRDVKSIIFKRYEKLGFERDEKTIERNLSDARKKLKMAKLQMT